MDYGKKISYDKLKMKECNGNLKTLYSDWQNKKKKCAMNSVVSAGYTADKVFGEKGVLTELDEISKKVDELLLNSLSFFENLGISFEETDEAAQKEIAKGGNQ